MFLEIPDRRFCQGERHLVWALQCPRCELERRWATLEYLFERTGAAEAPRVSKSGDVEVIQGNSFVQPGIEDHSVPEQCW